MNHQILYYVSTKSITVNIINAHTAVDKMKYKETKIKFQAQKLLLKSVQKTWKVL